MLTLLRLRKSYFFLCFLFTYFILFHKSLNLYNYIIRYYSINWSIKIAIFKISKFIIFKLNVNKTFLVLEKIVYYATREKNVYFASMKFDVGAKKSTFWPASRKIQFFHPKRLQSHSFYTLRISRKENFLFNFPSV